MRHHKPRVRMVTSGNTDSQSPASSMSSLQSSSYQDAGTNSDSHSGQSTPASDGAASSSSHLPSDADSHLHGHLLAAAKEVTAEMGFITPKDKLPYIYLTKDHHTFTTPFGPLSTQNSDWHSVVHNTTPGNLSQSPGSSGHRNKCVVTENSHPLMSTEQYYRIKCWIEKGSFGLESLPGQKHGAPKSLAHPEQYALQVQTKSTIQNPPGFISLGHFLPSFADSYVLPVNICGFNGLLTVDSGCSGCLATHLYLMEALGEDFYRYLHKYTGDNWFSADGSPIMVLGVFTAKIRLADFTCSQDVIVYRSTTKELLFGARFLKKYSIHITPTQLIMPVQAYEQHNKHLKVNRLATPDKPLYSLLLKSEQVIPPLAHQPIQVYIPSSSLSPADVHHISNSGLIAHSEHLENETDPDKMSVYYSMVHFSKDKLSTTLLYSNHTEDLKHLQKDELVAQAELMEPVSPSLVQVQGSPVLQVVQHMLKGQPRSKSSLPEFEHFYYESPELEVDERDFDNINIESSDPAIKSWVKELCLNNKEAFAKNKWDIGCTNEEIHFSVRSSCSPHQGKGYAVSPKLVERATQMLSALLNKGLLDYATNTSWSSNCFFVLKKNVEQDKHQRKDKELAMEKKTNISASYMALRMIIDLRQVNLSLRKTYTVWPLATTKSILYNLQTCKIASAYDLNQAFWQMKTTTSSSRILAINWLQKYHLMCLRVPHGLVCASSCLQMLLVKLLVKLGLDLKIPQQLKPSQVKNSHSPPQDQQSTPSLLGKPRTPGQSGSGAGNTYVFVDNIISAHQDVETHKKEVKILIEGLKAAGFLLKLKKCFFFISSKLEIFAWIVDLRRNLLYPPPARLQELQGLERPRTQRQCRGLVGSLLVYHDALPLINAVLKPLHQLNAHGAKFIWSPEAEAAFVEAKKLLSKASLLHLPDFQKPFFLLTDSAKGQYGHYTICQRHPQSHQLVALKHTSVPYTGAVAMYSQVKSEMYIGIHALANNTIFFVYSPSFWITDAASLQHLIVFRHSNYIMHNWSCFITSLNLHILPVPNTNAHLRFIDYFTRPGATKQQILEKLQKVKFSPETCDKVPILDLMGMGAVPVQTVFDLVDKFQICVKNLAPSKVQQLWKSFSAQGFPPVPDLTHLHPNNILTIKLKDQNFWQVVDSPQQIWGLKKGGETQFQEIKDIFLNLLPDISISHLQHLQQDDKYCSNLKATLKTPYEIIHGLLFKKVKDSPVYLLILPLSLSERLVNAFHTFGAAFHLKATKLKAQIQKNFVVQKLNQFVAKCVQTCEFCLVNFGPTKLSPKIQGISVWPQVAARFWHIDHCVIQSSFQKYNAVLTCVDIVSGALILIPGSSSDTDVIIIGQLFTHIVARFGAISGLASDGAGQLTSTRLNTICQMMMCKKFTVTAPRQNLSENAHFLVIRIFRFLHQKCNLTESLMPLFCGLTAIVYNLTISSKHNQSPQKILENFGPITKAVLPSKIPLSGFFLPPHADAFTLASWHCLQFLQMLRHKREEQKRMKTQQQNIKTKILAGDFCLLKRPIDTRRRVGVKLRPVMYTILFKCVQVRLKSVVLLPIQPERLIDNWRKKQGAAPKPKYLLVDIDRCKKVEYPHLYLKPALPVREFNVLVNKLEYHHDTPRIQFLSVSPAKGPTEVEDFLQTFCKQSIFSSEKLKAFQARMTQDYHNFCVLKMCFLRNTQPNTKQMIRVFTPEYMIQLKSSINFSSEENQEDFQDLKDSFKRSQNPQKVLETPLRSSNKPQLSLSSDLKISHKHLTSSQLVGNHVNSPILEISSGISQNPLNPRKVPIQKKKTFPSWRKFHIWPKSKEVDASSVSSFYRIIPNDVLAEDFFGFLNILIDDAQSEQNVTGSSSISHHSSGLASSSQQSTYEPARGSLGEASSQESQHSQESQERESTSAIALSGESVRIGSQPDEQTLEGVHQATFSLESTRSKSTHRRSLSASSSSSSLSSTLDNRTSSRKTTLRHTDFQQEGSGETPQLLPAVSITQAAGLPATVTVAASPSTTTGVVSIKIGNPQQLIKDAATSGGQPRHTPVVGPLGQTLTKR